MNESVSKKHGRGVRARGLLVWFLYFAKEPKGQAKYGKSAAVHRLHYIIVQIFCYRDGDTVHL